MPICAAPRLISKTLLVLSALCLGSAEISHAQTPPVPPAKKASIESLNKNLETSKKAKDSLEKRMGHIKNQLSNTRNDMVKIGQNIQSNETILRTLEAQIKEKDKEKTNLEGKLLHDRKSISRLILSLERLRRVPPEALILKPDTPYKTAQSAMLMESIIPALHKQARLLSENLKRLDILTIDLALKRENALGASERLKREHKKLSTLIVKREKLYGGTQKDLNAQKKTIARISRQAKNLEDLVEKLEKSRKEKAKKQNHKRKRIVSMPASGQARLPISGIITRRYNDPDHIGAPSKGLTIEGRGGALVVAPMGGIVRFAGHFKNYGNMVILEHKKNYHSLIAGLEKIDTVVGQSISIGEPLGILHHAPSPEEKPALYYELRLNGEPVNPTKKFIDLG